MSLRDLESGPFPFYDVRNQLKQFVYRRSMEAFAAGDRARDGVQTAEQLRERQRSIRDGFIGAIGGLPVSDAPLNPQITGVEECGEYRIEKVVFESRPNVYVTSNLYIPADASLPRGAVLFLCGHDPKAKHGERYHTVCQFLVRGGLVVLAVDPLGQGERLNYGDAATGRSMLTESYEHEHPGTQCWPLGDGLARYFLHDAMRAVDYLLTRPEVDKNKIGVTGSSGGGTQTAMMMMCDPRIAAAAPATFVTSREAYLYAGQPQDAEQIWPGWTADGFDHEDFLVAMAPRPALVLAAAYDCFPIEGTRRTVERARRFWRLFGREDDIDLFEDAAVHQYTDRLAEAATRFFTKHLFGREAAPSAADIRALDEAALRCTRSGQVRSEYPDARSIHDEILVRLHTLESERAEMSEPDRKKRAIEWMRERVFDNRKPCEMNPRHGIVRGWIDEMTVSGSLWWTQEGLMNYGLLLQAGHAGREKGRGAEQEKAPITIAVWDGGTSRLHVHLSWIRRTCEAGRSVLVLDVSGVGILEPYPFYATAATAPYGTVSKLCSDLFFLGDSLAAIRTYDVIRAADLLAAMKEVDKSDIRLYACGRYSVYAELASQLDERFAGIDTEQRLESAAELVRASYYDQYDAIGLFIPGMLRLFDLPDARRWAVDPFNQSGETGD